VGISDCELRIAGCGDCELHSLPGVSSWRRRWWRPERETGRGGRWRGEAPSDQFAIRNSQSAIPAPPAHYNSAVRRIAALVPLALASLAAWHYFDDLAGRKAVLETASTFAFDVRRPLETEMIGYAPSSDFAAQVLASSAISDALGSVRLTGLSPRERQAWLDVPLFLDDELAAAIDLQLDAIRRNPGWPLHRHYLGKLAFTRDRRSVGGDVDPGRWLTPLLSSWRSAPRHEAGVETLAAVLLEAWPLLTAEQRALTAELLREAFVDPQFVRLAFDVAVDVVGRDATLRSLPDEPASLAEAVRVLGRRGDVRDAAALHERWEHAEWQAREADLAAMRKRLERGDWKGLLAASSLWVSRHDVRAFDTPAARRQAAEVLALWPRDRFGSWRRDPRADIARFFLDGRMDAIDAKVLEAAVSSMSGVPAPVRARVALAAGNRAKAEALVREAGSEGAFEWTDYFVDLAREAIARGDLRAAIAAFDRISPSARRECDVLVARRQSGEELDPPALSVTDDSGAILEASWSANGMLGICVDPSLQAGRTLAVTLATSSPALVEWGVNGGRRGTTVVDGEETIKLPLSGMAGRSVVYARALWGGPIVRRDARAE
jgi:hypothetical protein